MEWSVSRTTKRESEKIGLTIRNESRFSSVCLCDGQIGMQDLIVSVACLLPHFTHRQESGCTRGWMDVGLLLVNRKGMMMTIVTAKCVSQWQ